jgi:hypothetical protein
LSELARVVKGDDPGQSDKVPALVSPGEYVMDATTVAHLGDGNTEAGVAALDKLRANVAKHKGQRQVVPPRAKSPERYMGGR